MFGPSKKQLRQDIRDLETELDGFQLRFESLKRLEKRNSDMLFHLIQYLGLECKEVGAGIFAFRIKPDKPVRKKK